jgi:hypothetical protein
MGSVLTFKRMRRRLLPFCRQGASRALAPTSPTLSPTMTWRKRPPAPVALSPQAAQPITNIRNETHIHPTRDTTRLLIHFASIRQHDVVASAICRPATSGIARLHEPSRHVERVLHHVWRRHDPGQRSHPHATLRSPSTPAPASREHRHTIHFATSRRLRVSYGTVQASRGAAITPAARMSTALDAGPQAAPPAPSTSLAGLSMRFPARHPPSTRLERKMIARATPHEEARSTILPVAFDVRLPRGVSPAGRTLPSEVSLEWRKAVQKIATQSSSSASAPHPDEQAYRGAASLPGRAVPGSGPSSLAPHRDTAPTVDPAFTDRLVDDVIRRIERRQRIERERRGL